MYKQLLRPVFFKTDPERIHEVVLDLGRRIGASPIMLRAIRGLWGAADDARLSVKVFNLEFANPIGLAAGFDKDAKAIPFLSALGFGHIEAGTITPAAQPGNPKPRIFRLPADQALINRMGFPSQGMEVAAQRLNAVNRAALAARVGVNFGKAKATPIDHAVDDYLNAFRRLQACGDFFVINVSSPNTPELRKLQEPERLSQLFSAIQAVNKGRKPLLVKIAPDLEYADLDAILECCLASAIDGLIATNTTIAREGLSTVTSETGGLSGRPLASRSVKVLRYIRERSCGKLPLISSGGIFTASDVIERMRAGASMVQIYTGFIYEGPGIMRKISEDLLAFAVSEGIKNIDEIVGQG